MFKRLSQVLKGRGEASSWWEIFFVVGCVLVSEWVTPIFFGKSWLAGAIPAFIALAFIIFSQIAKSETLKDQGWRIDNFFKAAGMLVPLMLIASLFLVSIGWCLGNLQGTNTSRGIPLVWTSLGLLVWGLTQQYSLQAFINRRAQEIWGPGKRSVLFVGAIFALLHTPNLWLVLATFFGGLMWSYVYQRAPNLWALAISHAMMTAVLVLSVPYAALQGLRVGYNYFL